MGKKKKKKTSRTLISGLIAILIIALVALYFVQEHRHGEELEKIYQTFTCNCCDGTLLGSDEICAVGYKEEIENLQESGLHGEKLFHASVQLLGLHNIANPDLRADAFLHFQDNPPEGPRILTREDGINLGEVSETRTPIVFKDFTIGNNGTAPLLIHAVDTSCSCLSAKFLTQEWESPEYGRFSDPNGQLITIDPGKEVRLRVRYDARINSFFRGYELRHVRVYSNDVLRPVTMFKIEATHVD